MLYAQNTQRIGLTSSSTESVSSHISCYALLPSRIFANLELISKQISDLLRAINVVLDLGPRVYASKAIQDLPSRYTTRNFTLAGKKYCKLDNSKWINYNQCRKLPKAAHLKPVPWLTLTSRSHMAIDEEQEMDEAEAANI